MRLQFAVKKYLTLTLGKVAFGPDNSNLSKIKFLFSLSLIEVLEPSMVWRTLNDTKYRNHE